MKIEIKQSMAKGFGSKPKHPNKLTPLKSNRQHYIKIVDEHVDLVLEEEKPSFKDIAERSSN